MNTMIKLTKYAQKAIYSLVVFTALLTGSSFQKVYGQEKLNVALAGLSHDHVNLIMNDYSRGLVHIIGIAESNKDLVEKFKKRANLPDSIFYNTLDDLLKHKKPDAVLAFNAIEDHLSVVETAAPYHISVMVEKPLAVSVKHAERMIQLAKQYNIHLLTNYETTWYASNQELYQKIKKEQSIGNIRKMVAHDGHKGPKEIGVSKEFLSWLTDPVKNGGGAVIDFGCYGANLMTWMMDGKAPISVTAVLKQIKKDVYPKVDDDATILLEYPDATGIIEASWNWPFNIKDFEVFGQSGYLQAVDPGNVRSREHNRDTYQIIQPAALPPSASGYLGYLSAVLKGEINPANDLSSTENNLIVVKILEAAKESAKKGQKVYLK